MTTTFTLTSAEFRRLTSPVLPFASKDPMLPILCGVHLFRRGDFIGAAASDRFKAGLARVPASADGKDWSLTISTQTVKAITSTFATTRKGTVTLRFAFGASELAVKKDEGELLQSLDASVTYPLVPGDYPDVLKLFAKQLDAPEGPVPTSFAAGHLQPLHAVGGNFVMRTTGADAPAVFVTEGDRLDGIQLAVLVMPRKYEAGVESRVAPWRDWLAPAKASRKAAS